MNEVQFIRGELARQRRRARVLAAAWSTRNGKNINSNSDTYDAYFVFFIDLETRRLESHLERLRTRSDLSDGERVALEQCAREFATLAAGRAIAAGRALAARDTAAGAATTRNAAETTRNADELIRLSALAEKLEAIADSRYAVDDWRRTAHVDADSILEERRLHQQVGDEIDGAPSG